MPKNRIPLRYPVYIPSKGRATLARTPAALDAIGVPYFLVVEETEADEYAQRWSADRLLVLPFHDLGQGSIPARNWIWEHAEQHGAERHWIIDDNVDGFIRMNHNRRVPVACNGTFRAVEDFTDRYTNIALAGMNYRFFAADRSSRIPPIYWNTRVYSITLIDTSLPFRWRGRYNEDTDLSLRALKAGWCTALFNPFLANKAASQTVKGGNTDHVYTDGDHRLTFAKSLQEQHPDEVEVIWRYGRWHHLVDYSAFTKNRPVLRPEITPTVGSDEYGMVLRRGNWRTLNQRETTA